MTEQVAHPVVAVVDKQQAQTVIWRVETTPGFAALSGAWITADDAEVTNLTTNAVVLNVGEPLEAERVTSLEAIVAAMVQAGVTAMPDLDTTPRYTGEPAAQSAWSTAVQLAELVEAWHTFDTRRRQREKDDVVRALPTPTPV